MPDTSESAWRRRTRTPVLLVTLGVWVALVVMESGARAHQEGASDMRGMTGMHATNGVSMPMVVLMVAAMMTPLIIPAIRHGRARSLRRRRRRSVVLQVATHGVVWLVGGVVLQVVAVRLLGLLGPLVAPLVVLTAAVVWHATPIAQRWGNRHHALPPLAAFGPAADRDLVWFGTRHAAYCLGACWVLMLLPALCGGYQLAVMACASAWVWALALETPVRPGWRFRIPRSAGRAATSQLRVLGGRRRERSLVA